MFYAFHNTYGNGTTDTHDERLGTLHVFKTKLERDEWVNAEHFDGNWHREVIGYSAARHEMRGAYSCETGRDPSECGGMADWAEALAGMENVHLVQFH